jgi:Tol biopolymer transport system component
MLLMQASSSSASSVDKRFVAAAILSLLTACGKREAVASDLEAELLRRGAVEHLAVAQVNNAGIFLLRMGSESIERRFVGPFLPAAFSPRGDRVLGCDLSTRLLRLVRMDGSTDHELAEAGPTTRHLALSWDGQKVAAVTAEYLDDEQGRVKVSLVIIDLASQAKSVLLTEALNSAEGIWGRPSWSPDGRAVTLARKETIEIVHLGDGQASSLLRGSMPSWSPDGASIAYRAPNGLLMLFDISKKTARQLARECASSSGLAWSKDGGYLLYAQAPSASQRTGTVREFDMIRLVVHRVTDGASHVLPGFWHRNMVTGFVFDSK